MSEILLTGAAGFIGYETARQLLKDGKKVVGIDNMNDYYDPILKEHRLALTENENFTFHKLDIENLEDMRELFKQYDFDRVINLAARAGVPYSMKNPYVYVTTNTTGTLNLLECMREFNVKKMVLASTSSLYAGQEMPFDETLPVNTPISSYAASKKAAELLGHTYHFLYDMDITVVRYFTVYGPAGRPDMSIFRFIKWIEEGNEIELFGDGTQSRDFTYVEDIARGTILASEKKLGYEILNLGGGQNPISLNEIIATLEVMIGKKAKIRNEAFHKTDIKATWANISKANKLLGWEPYTSLNDGLKKTVDWYFENIDLCRKVKL